MDQVLRVDSSQTVEHAFDYVCALLEVNHSIISSCLERVNVALITKLHHNKDPSLI